MVCAGIVASAVLNPQRRKGQRPYKPTDWLKPETEILSPEEFARRMRGWASEHNQAIAEA